MKIVDNTSPINTVKSKQNNVQTFFSSSDKCDVVSFKGLSIKSVKDKQEINEVVNLFYDALCHNLEPNKKQKGFLSKASRYISTLPFKIVAKKTSSITEVVQNEGKLVGGYSMNLDMKNSSAHIGFVTLAPNVMRSRIGINTLKTIGKRICANLELNNIKDITWSTNSNNKSINSLLKKINAEPVRKIGSETEYKISLDDLKKILSKL